MVSIQNHDQVGNRAVGDRHAATLSPGQVVCGAAILFCSPFTPMVFMGEEWGARTPWQFFAHFPDDTLNAAVRDGRRSEFAEHCLDDDEEVPDPTSDQAFLDSKLDWSEPEEEPHSAVLTAYRELIALRKSRPELSDPWLDDVEVDVDEEARTLLLHRGSLRLAVNLGDDEVTFALSAPIGRLLLASEPVEIDDDALTVGPQAFAIAEMG